MTSGCGCIENDGDMRQADLPRKGQESPDGENDPFINTE